MNGKVCDLNYVIKEGLASFRNKCEELVFENNIAGTKGLSFYDTPKFDLSSILVISEEIRGLMQDAEHLVSLDAYLQYMIDNADDYGIDVKKYEQMLVEAKCDFETIAWAGLINSGEEFIDQKVSKFVKSSEMLTVIDGNVLDKILSQANQFIAGVMAVYSFYYNDINEEYDYFLDDGGLNVFKDDLADFIGADYLGLDWVNIVDMVANDYKFKFLRKMLSVNSVGMARQIAIVHDEEVCFCDEITEYFNIIETNINRNNPGYCEQTKNLIDGVRTVVNGCIAKNMAIIRTNLSIEPSLTE